MKEKYYSLEKMKTFWASKLDNPKLQFSLRTRSAPFSILLLFICLLLLPPPHCSGISHCGPRACACWSLLVPAQNWMKRPQAKIGPFPFSLFFLFVCVCVRRLSLDEVNRTTMVKLGNGQFSRPNVCVLACKFNQVKGNWFICASVDPFGSLTFCSHTFLSKNETCRHYW